MVWRWEHPSFHHDMCRMPNGNTIMITWDKCDAEIAKKVKGGYPPDQEARLKSDPEHVNFFMGGLGVGGRPRDLTGYLADTILEVSPAGDVIHSWHSWEHCDLETDFMCPMEFPYEWTHSDSVKYYPDGTVLLSFREISLVMLISWPDGEVLWRWGRDVVSHQHDATLTPEGNVLVFDNGTHHPAPCAGPNPSPPGGTRSSPYRPSQASSGSLTRAECGGSNSRRQALTASSSRENP